MLIEDVDADEASQRNSHALAHSLNKQRDK